VLAELEVRRVGDARWRDQGAELLAGVAAAAVHGAGDPAVLAGVEMAAEVDPQLPAVAATVSHRSGHDRRR
jgi:hypothetical protein